VVGSASREHGCRCHDRSCGIARKRSDRDLAPASRREAAGLLRLAKQRRAVEQHAARQGVRTFVSHASLSVSERRQAEAAFAEEKDCVIVATSTLELGIDVGDLDRVIQIDSPSSVSSFLQRMGEPAGVQAPAAELPVPDDE
jgi:ATP-dependent helicase YprA (DUF1998 family)